MVWHCNTGSSNSEEMPSKFWRKIISTLRLYHMPKNQWKGKVKIKKFSDTQVFKIPISHVPPFTRRHCKICSTNTMVQTKKDGDRREQTGHPTESSTRKPRTKNEKARV